MINRPSYAQRTLEVTLHSLQRLPTDLTPAVSGVIVAAVDEPELVPNTAACTRTTGRVSLHRWRRKGVDPRMAVR